MKLKVALTLLALLPLSATAHDGHGSSQAHSLLHYLTEPLHIIPVAIVVALGVAMWRRRKAR
ncbi:MAG: hypothetical protein NXH95_18820 [Pseudomonadaceae bacterium]|nr:hypothetical protein [Pseudomonadaceae bacterium]